MSASIVLYGSLQAAFATELVRRRKLYPPSFVHYLAEGMELRHRADYSDLQIPFNTASIPIRLPVRRMSSGLASSKELSSSITISRAARC
jgi:hypothetical protein